MIRVNAKESANQDVLSPGIAINALITSERQAIDEYTYALEHTIGLSDENIEQLSEILKDEQDHLVILTSMYAAVTQQEFPDSGES